MKILSVKQYAGADYPTLRERQEKRFVIPCPVTLAMMLAALAVIMQGCEGCWGVS